MGKFKGAWVVAVGCAVGCGQDLALPDGYGQPATSGGAGPADGVTGQSGASGASGATQRPTPMGAGSGPSGGASAATGGASTSSGAGGGGRKAAEQGDGGQSISEGGEAGTGPEVTAPPPVLLFSEYVEGSGSFKALEIFALEGGSLEQCELQTFSNGKAEPAKLALHGSLEAGEVQVLCSSSLAMTGASPCSRSTNLSFNGDDALSLVCQGIVQDIIGEPGVDPGASWGMGATLDHTLQRRCEITAGRSDPATPFAIDAEWLTFGVDTFSDLGQRRCE